MEWVLISGWPKFQHYGPERRPAWIKDYLDQHDHDEYMELTLAQRGLLQDLRRLYARRNGILPKDPARISRALNVTVRERQLEALNQAGFVQFVASKPLALSLADTRAGARARTRSREKEKDLPKKVSKQKSAAGRKVTGWRMVRGTHGVTHIPDPAGVDIPPPDARPLKGA